MRLMNVLFCLSWDLGLGWAGSASKEKKKLRVNYVFSPYYIHHISI